MLRIRLLVGISGGVCVAYALCRIASHGNAAHAEPYARKCPLGHEHIGVARARIEPNGRNRASGGVWRFAP